MLTKRETFSLIKVKSCNTLWRMLLVYIRIYLMSVLKHKFWILRNYHQNILYLRQQGCEDSWILFEAKRGPRANKLRNHWSKALPLRYLQSLEHGCVEGNVKVTLCQIATPLGESRQHDADLHTLQSHRDLTIPRRYRRSAPSAS